MTSSLYALYGSRKTDVFDYDGHYHHRVQSLGVQSLGARSTRPSNDLLDHMPHRLVEKGPSQKKEKMSSHLDNDDDDDHRAHSRQTGGRRQSYQQAYMMHMCDDDAEEDDCKGNKVEKPFMTIRGGKENKPLTMMPHMYDKIALNSTVARAGLSPRSGSDSARTKLSKSTPSSIGTAAVSSSTKTTRCPSEREQTLALKRSEESSQQSAPKRPPFYLSANDRIHVTTCMATATRPAKTAAATPRRGANSYSTPLFSSSSPIHSSSFRPAPPCDSFTSNAFSQQLLATSEQREPRVSGNPLQSVVAAEAETKEKQSAVVSSCILCSALLPSSVSLREHMLSCPANTASCPHCRKGFQVRVLQRHIQECQQHGRACFVCDALVPAKTYLTHVSTCRGGGKGKGREKGEGEECDPLNRPKLVPVRMYHGTTEEAAQQILSTLMFQPSEKGLLGEGVYVTADIKKALRYGPAVLECAVYPGKTITIAKRFHPHQKNWRRYGYDSAWIPPNSFVSTSKRSGDDDDDDGEEDKEVCCGQYPNSGADGAALSTSSDSEAARSLSDREARLAGTRNATGGELEENCIGDPRRVVPLRLVRGGHE